MTDRPLFQMPKEKGPPPPPPPMRELRGPFGVETEASKRRTQEWRVNAGMVDPLPVKKTFLERYPILAAIIGRPLPESRSKEMDNKLLGYRELSPATKAKLDRIKEMEIEVGALWKELASDPDTDPRLINVAKTELQGAFSWLIRSVAKPVDVYGVAPARAER